MGKLQFANQVAALGLAAANGQADISLAVNRPLDGHLVLELDGQELVYSGVSLLPGQAHRQAIDLGDDVPDSGRLTLRLESNGMVLAGHSAEFNLK
jgi:hypothetical protein